MQDSTVNSTSEQLKQPTYRAALEELGFSWEWDPATYGTGREGLRAYLEREQAHLLRAYEADFLVNAIEAAKSRCQAARRS
jgi:hypothetical protein